MNSTYLPEGSDLKSWAVVVKGYGTYIIADEDDARDQARHFEGRGREVTLVQLGPVVSAADSQVKPTLLQWNELQAGYYWAFPLDASTRAEGDDCLFVHVSERDGILGNVEGDNWEAISESWGFFQYLPCAKPSRSQVTFQESDLMQIASDSMEGFFS
jgi:hypothetical protein